MPDQMPRGDPSSTTSSSTEGFARAPSPAPQQTAPRLADAPRAGVTGTARATRRGSPVRARDVPSAETDAKFSVVGHQHAEGVFGGGCGVVPAEFGGEVTVVVLDHDEDGTRGEDVAGGEDALGGAPRVDANNLEEVVGAVREDEAGGGHAALAVDDAVELLFLGRGFGARGGRGGVGRARARGGVGRRAPGEAHLAGFGLGEDDARRRARRGRGRGLRLGDGGGGYRANASRRAGAICGRALDARRGRRRGRDRATCRERLHRDSRAGVREEGESGLRGEVREGCRWKMDRRGSRRRARGFGRVACARSSGHVLEKRLPVGNPRDPVVRDEDPRNDSRTAVYFRPTMHRCVITHADNSDSIGPVARNRCARDVLVKIFSLQARFLPATSRLRYRRLCAAASSNLPTYARFASAVPARSPL